jgi:hypothetical protein
MKKMVCLSLVSILFIVVQAQIPDVVNKAATSASAAAGPGQLLTQFGSAIKTTSLLSSFAGQKSGWLAKAGKVTDAVGMAQSVATLAGGIKPSMFKTGFNVSSLIAAASTVKTLAGAGGLLKNLSGGLKPEALSTGWAAQQPAWETALGLLK